MLLIFELEDIQNYKQEFMQILENDQKTTSCKFWRRVRFYANFGQTLLNRVQQSHSFLWHFGFYVAHCTHLRKGKYFVCVKYISKESSSTARQQWPIWKDVLGSENFKMRNNISFYYGKPLLEIAATECWQLSADHFIGAFVCLVWRPGLPQHCCLFSSQSCILWAAFSLWDLVSGGACFLKCASWRITPLECLWEGESINPRQIFHLFRFSGSTLNWDYRFCHNHLFTKIWFHIEIRNPNFLFADQVNHLLTLLGVPGCCEWVPGVGRQTEFSDSSQGAARGTWSWTLGQLYRPMYDKTGCGDVNQSETQS